MYKIIIDCSTREETIVELTAGEVAVLEAAQAVARVAAKADAAIAEQKAQDAADLADILKDYRGKRRVEALSGKKP